MAKKKIKLGFLRSLAINLAFGILDEVADVIEDDLWRKWAKSHIDPLRQLIDVLTDKNPENNKQLKELFQLYGKDYAGEQLEFVKGLVERYVKEEKTKSLIVMTIESLIKELNEATLTIQ